MNTAMHTAMKLLTLALNHVKEGEIEAAVLAGSRAQALLEALHCADCAEADLARCHKKANDYLFDLDLGG